MIAALVPVKRLGAGKSRLLAGFEPEGVRALQTAMLRDVLAALAGVEAVGQRVVVTEDPAVAAVAEAAGARALVREDDGLNPSIEGACRILAAEGADGVLVVLGDVAGARSEDLAELVAAAPNPGAALAPSRDGGSAALLRRPPDAFPACFGPASAEAHRAAARRAGVPLREVAGASLCVDVDRPEDLEACLAGGGAEHTRKALRRLGWQGAA